MTWFDRWVWPAGGSGGIPGDVLGTFVWVLIVAIVGTFVWPPTRHAIVAFVDRHARDLKAHMTAHHEAAQADREELLRHMQHIIKHHPDIPDIRPKEDT